MKQIEFTVLSQPKELYTVFEYLTQFGKEINCPVETMLDIKLCIDEAFANIIKHAYQDKQDGKIYFLITVPDDRIEIIIRDFGKKIDPETIKPRDLDDLKPHGLGVLLIHRLMDKVEYNFANPDFNELKLVKYTIKK
ncbi:MAG: ATP-binding protein [Elusimicrobiota bacterium]